MKVSVFGLGYVGTVTSACLADLGHEVLGVDVASAKVDAVRSGRSPIVEAEVGGHAVVALELQRVAAEAVLHVGRRTARLRLAITAVDRRLVEVNATTGREREPGQGGNEDGKDQLLHLNVTLSGTGLVLSSVV